MAIKNRPPKVKSNHDPKTMSKKFKHRVIAEMVRWSPPNKLSAALADDGMAILQGAVCLITGGFGGIGQAIARELARGLRVRARWPDRYRRNRR